MATKRHELYDQGNDNSFAVTVGDSRDMFLTKSKPVFTRDQDLLVRKVDQSELRHLLHTSHVVSGGAARTKVGLTVQLQLVSKIERTSGHSPKGKSKSFRSWRRLFLACHMTNLTTVAEQ